MQLSNFIKITLDNSDNILTAVCSLNTVEYKDEKKLKHVVMVTPFHIDNAVGRGGKTTPTFSHLVEDHVDQDVGPRSS